MIGDPKCLETFWAWTYHQSRFEPNNISYVSVSSCLNFWSVGHIVKQVLAMCVQWLWKFIHMWTMPNNHATPNFIQIHPPEVMLASTLLFWSNCTFVKQVLASQLQMTPNLVCTLNPVYNRAMHKVMPRKALYSPETSTSTCSHMPPFTKELPCTLLCLSPKSPEL